MLTWQLLRKKLSSTPHSSLPAQRVITALSEGQAKVKAERVKYERHERAYLLRREIPSPAEKRLQQGREGVIKYSHDLQHPNTQDTLRYYLSVEQSLRGMLATHQQDVPFHFIPEIKENKLASLISMLLLFLWEQLDWLVSFIGHFLVFGVLFIPVLVLGVIGMFSLFNGGGDIAYFGPVLLFVGIAWFGYAAKAWQEEKNSSKSSSVAWRIEGDRWHRESILLPRWKRRLYDQGYKLKSITVVIEGVGYWRIAAIPQIKTWVRRELINLANQIEDAKRKQEEAFTHYHKKEKHIPLGYFHPVYTYRSKITPSFSISYDGNTRQSGFSLSEERIQRYEQKPGQEEPIANAWNRRVDELVHLPVGVAWCRVQNAKGELEEHMKPSRVSVRRGKHAPVAQKDAM